MYAPDDVTLKVAIRYGETIRDSMVRVEAFDAAEAMRDLLALAYRESAKRAEDAAMRAALQKET